MSNLLSIESAFLSLPAVKQALNLQEIRAVQRTITNAKKKKFEQTLALSKLVGQVVAWFGSDEGQRLCAEEGISWTNEQIGQKVFGWQKSFFYKVVKASKLKDEVVESFNAKCNELERQGEDPNRSLEGLLKFAKQVENAPAGSGQGEGAEGEGGANEPQVDARPKAFFTFEYRPHPDANTPLSLRYGVKMQIMSDGQIKVVSPECTDNEEALAYAKNAVWALNQYVNNPNY
jgi:hypothetical protein